MLVLGVCVLHYARPAQILAQELRRALRAILMIDSVKAVAANPLREPFIRAGVDRCSVGQSAVEASFRKMPRPSGCFKSRAIDFLFRLT